MTTKLSLDYFHKPHLQENFTLDQIMIFFKSILINDQFSSDYHLFPINPRLIFIKVCFAFCFCLFLLSTDCCNGSVVLKTKTFYQLKIKNELSVQVSRRLSFKRNQGLKHTHTHTYTHTHTHTHTYIYIYIYTFLFTFPINVISKINIGFYHICQISHTRDLN